MAKIIEKVEKHIRHDEKGKPIEVGGYKRFIKKKGKVKSFKKRYITDYLRDTNTGRYATDYAKNPETKRDG